MYPFNHLEDLLGSPNSQSIHNTRHHNAPNNDPNHYHQDLVHPQQIKNDQGEENLNHGVNVSRVGEGERQ